MTDTKDDPWPESAPDHQVFDGQAYYDKYIRPFVEKHGERNRPLDSAARGAPANTKGDSA